MRLAIDHRLIVSVPPGLSQAMFHLLLTPSDGPTQRVESWTIDMPGIENAARFVDGFGNLAHLANQPRTEGDMAITVRGVVVTEDRNGVLGRPPGEPVPALFRRVTASGKVPASVHARLRSSGQTRLDLLHALMARVGDTLGHPEEPQASRQMQADGWQVQTQGEVQAAEPRPAASDYVHLFVGGARALDIPARYVIGYRLGSDGVGAVHAWAEAFDDGLGWIGFDPHAQICPTERYVRLAIGLDAEAVPLVRIVPACSVSETVEIKAA